MLERLLIDGRMAVNGGGYTHLVNVVPRLARLRPELRLGVVVRCPRAARALAGIPGVRVLPFDDRGALSRLRFTLRTLPEVARDFGADLLFSVSEYAPPSAPCPVVASFRNPNLFSRFRWQWPAREWPRFETLRALARLSARRCARILFVSEDSARWIGDAAGVPDDRRVVVHHGIDAPAFARPSESPHPRPYLLSVGSIYRYKNYVRMIEAYGTVARRDAAAPDLVLIGDDQDPEFHARMRLARDASGVAGRIHLLGEIPYEAVPPYYAHAAAFLFLSYLETFGHPLLEAMASDTPLVAADVPVFREIAGPAALYADPFRTELIEQALQSAIDDPDLREVLVKEGRERVRGFTWERNARELLAVFDTVVSEHAT